MDWVLMVCTNFALKVRKLIKSIQESIVQLTVQREHPGTNPGTIPWNHLPGTWSRAL